MVICILNLNKWLCIKAYSILASRIQVYWLKHGGKSTNANNRFPCLAIWLTTCVIAPMWPVSYRKLPRDITLSPECEIPQPPCWDWWRDRYLVNTNYTIETNIHRVRSWKHGVRCMSHGVLMLIRELAANNDTVILFGHLFLHIVQKI